MVDYHRAVDTSAVFWLVRVDPLAHLIPDQCLGLVFWSGVHVLLVPGFPFCNSIHLGAVYFLSFTINFHLQFQTPNSMLPFEHRFPEGDSPRCPHILHAVSPAFSQFGSWTCDQWLVTLTAKWAEMVPHGIMTAIMSSNCQYSLLAATSSRDLLYSFSVCLPYVLQLFGLL